MMEKSHHSLKDSVERNKKNKDELKKISFHFFAICFFLHLNQKLHVYKFLQFL